MCDAFAGLNSTGDFGLGVFFLAESDLRVKSVERLFPAGLAGIHRSWRVTMINGNTNLSTLNSAFIVSNVYKSPTSIFTFTKPDGSSVNVTPQHVYFIVSTGTASASELLTNNLKPFMDVKLVGP